MESCSTKWQASSRNRMVSQPASLWSRQMNDVQAFLRTYPQYDALNTTRLRNWYYFDRVSVTKVIALSVNMCIYNDTKDV